MKAVTEPVKHPAKFNADIMDVIAQIVFREVTSRDYEATYRVFDPFAGVGTIHRLRSTVLGVETFGFELEPEWAKQSPHTIVGDSRKIYAYFGEPLFDAIVTSPCYGNRMADHHNAREGSKRNTYKHTLGRDLSEGSSAGMQWGDEYREFHEDVWAQCVKILKPGGVFVLNMKDHVRKGAIQHVTDWHLEVLTGLGLEVEHSYWIEAKGNRQGENGDVRVDHETITVLRKPLDP